MGPEYGDPIGAMAVEHALTRTVRDSAAILGRIYQRGSEAGLRSQAVRQQFIARA